MSEQLDEGLKFIVETMQESKEFIATQAPDVIHQMIQYDTITSWIGISIGMVIVLLGIVGFIKAERRTVDRNEFLEADSRFIAMAFMIIFIMRKLLQP